MNPGEIVAQAESILTATEEQVNAALADENPKEAKRLVAAGRQELRILKREISTAERSARAAGRQSGRTLSAGSQIVGALGGPEVRRWANRGRMAGRAAMNQKQGKDSQEYRRAKDEIDRHISQIDGLKINVDAALSRERDALREARRTERQNRQATRQARPTEGD